MDAALIVIGRGDTPGVHSKAFQLDIPQIDDNLLRNGDQSLQSTIQQRAALSQRQIPIGGEQALYKISRFADEAKRVWTWIGRYDCAVFAGENRGGHYVGIGIAFAERLISEEIIGVLTYLLNHFLADVTQDGLVVGSVEQWMPKSEELDIIETLRFTKLPSGYSGIQAGSDMAVQRFCQDWSDSAVGRTLIDQLYDYDLSNLSTVFLTNWRSSHDGEEFYDGITKRSSNAVRSASASDSSHWARQAGMRPRAYEVDADKLREFSRRLSQLERGFERLDDSERRRASNRRERERSPVLWVLVALVTLILALQIFSAFSSKMFR